MRFLLNLYLEGLLATAIAEALLGVKYRTKPSKTLFFLLLLVIVTWPAFIVGIVLKSFIEYAGRILFHLERVGFAPKRPEPEGPFVAVSFSWGKEDPRPE